MKTKCPYNLCTSKSYQNERFCKRHLKYKAQAEARKRRLSYV